MRRILTLLKAKWFSMAEVRMSNLETCSRYGSLLTQTVQEEHKQGEAKGHNHSMSSGGQFDARGETGARTVYRCHKARIVYRHKHNVVVILNTNN